MKPTPATASSVDELTSVCSGGNSGNIQAFSGAWM